MQKIVITLSTALALGCMPIKDQSQLSQDNLTTSSKSEKPIKLTFPNANMVQLSIEDPSFDYKQLIERYDLTKKENTEHKKVYADYKSSVLSELAKTSRDGHKDFKVFINRVIDHVKTEAVNPFQQIEEEQLISKLQKGLEQGLVNLRKIQAEYKASVENNDDTKTNRSLKYKKDRAERDLSEWYNEQVKNITKKYGKWESTYEYRRNTRYKGAYTESWGSKSVPANLEQIFWKKKVREFEHDLVKNKWTEIPILRNVYIDDEKFGLFTYRGQQFYSLISKKKGGQNLNVMPEKGDVEKRPIYDSSTHTLTIYHAENIHGNRDSWGGSYKTKAYGKNTVTMMMMVLRSIK